MAVVLADGAYRVAKRAHPWQRDSHGTPIPSPLGWTGPARPGAATLRPDRSWALRLDPAQWPIEAGDKITGPNGRTWTVTGEPRLIRNPAASDVDYIQVTAALDPPEVP